MSEMYEVPNKSKMGRRITTMRIANGMSREQLAEKVGISAQFLADIEYGNKGMSLKTFYIICQALGVSADYLLNVNNYSKDEHNTRSFVCEEIMETLKYCDEKQLKSVGDIVRIYVESVKKSL